MHRHFPQDSVFEMGLLGQSVVGVHDCVGQQVVELAILVLGMLGQWGAEMENVFGGRCGDDGGESRRFGTCILDTVAQKGVGGKRLLGPMGEVGVQRGDGGCWIEVWVGSGVVVVMKGEESSDGDDGGRVDAASSNRVPFMQREGSRSACWW